MRHQHPQHKLATHSHRSPEESSTRPVRNKVIRNVMHRALTVSVTIISPRRL